MARIRENRQVHERKREREGRERELRNFNYVRKKLPSKKPFFIKITLNRVLVLPKQNVRFPVMFLTRERKRARRNTESKKVNEAGNERRGKEEKGRHSSLEWRKVAENVRVKKQRESSLAFQRWETTLRLEGTALLSQLSKCAKVCSKEEQASGARRRENRRAEWMGKNKEEWFGIEKARKYDRNGSPLAESSNDSTLYPPIGFMGTAWRSCGPFDREIA